MPGTPHWASLQLRICPYLLMGTPRVEPAYVPGFRVWWQRYTWYIRTPGVLCHSLTALQNLQKFRVRRVWMINMTHRSSGYSSWVWKSYITSHSGQLTIVQLSIISFLLQLTSIVLPHSSQLKRIELYYPDHFYWMTPTWFFQIMFGRSPRTTVDTLIPQMDDIEATTSSRTAGTTCNR